MISCADTLSDRRRKQFRTYAYASTWFGRFSDVMPENSAIIILYLAVLGASNTLIMLSAGLAGIVSMFLLIPASGIVDRFGTRRVVATWQYGHFSFSIFQTIFLLCSGFAFFCLILVFCIPCVVPEHDDYYCP